MAHVLLPYYSQLFTDEDRRVARQRLGDLGFDVDAYLVTRQPATRPVHNGPPERRRREAGIAHRSASIRDRVSTMAQTTYTPSGRRSAAGTMLPRLATATSSASWRSDPYAGVAAPHVINSPTPGGVSHPCRSSGR